jgi:hypothetical protein
MNAKTQLFQPFDPRRWLTSLNQPPSLIVDDQEADLQTSPGERPPQGAHVKLSPRLANWLLDLRLLRHIPLPYLVPDPKLLPPESIRFFHIDPTWVDRVIDGAMSAANIGTVDMTMTPATVTGLRTFLDEKLHLDGKGTISGMLIRSEIVARWPGMQVLAYRPAPPPPDNNDKKTLVSPPGNVPILRKDTLSKNMMIVLFAGVPDEIRLREPHVGMRFGVEPKREGPGYVVSALPLDEQVGLDQEDPKAQYDIAFRDGLPPDKSTRVINVLGLGIQIYHAPAESRAMALHLLRPPYVQMFVGDTKDAPQGTSLTPGSQPSTGENHLKLMNGRVIHLRPLTPRGP